MNMVLRGCMLWKGQEFFGFFGRQRVETRRGQNIKKTALRFTKIRTLSDLAHE